MKNNDLPSNWTWVKLSDLVENPKSDIVDGPFGSDLKATEYQSSGIPIIRLQNIDRHFFIDKNIKFVSPSKAKELDRHNFKSGDIVLTKLGDPLGKACLVPPKFAKGIIVADIVRIRNLKILIDKEFLLHSINSDYIVKQLKTKTKGTTRPRVNLYHIRRFEVKLPPLPEQKKIVERIEELFSGLDRGVASLKKAKEQIRLYRQSVLASAFRGELNGQSAESRVQSEILRAAEPKVDYSNQLPDGWKWVKLGEIIKVSSGKGLTSANMFNDGLYSVYGGNGVSGYYNEFLYEEPRLIIGRVGAKCGVIHITRPESWVTDNALIVDFISNNVEMKFLYHCLDYHNLNKLSVSTAQPVISGAKIYPYEIMLPPLERQTQIVEEIEKRFSEADNLEKAIDESLAKSETLRQSILKQAFEGKLI